MNRKLIVAATTLTLALSTVAPANALTVDGFVLGPDRTFINKANQVCHVPETTTQAIYDANKQNFVKRLKDLEDALVIAVTPSDFIKIDHEIYELELKTEKILGCPENAKSHFINILRTLSAQYMTDNKAQAEIRAEFIKLGLSEDRAKLLAPDYKDPFKSLDEPTPTPTPSPGQPKTAEKNDSGSNDSGSSIGAALGLAVGIPLLAGVGLIMYLASHVNEIRAGIGLPPLR